MIGKHCWEIAHCSNQPIPECPALRVKKSLCRESMELPIGGRWFAVYVDPILDADGGISGFVHIVSDITERKRAEAALRESEKNFRVLFDENPLPTILSEISSEKITFVNRRMADLLGMDVNDVIGKTANELGVLKNSDDQEKLTGLIVGQGYVDNVEVERVSPDGTVGANLISMRLITVNGKPCCLSVLQDIAERKRMEEVIQRTAKLDSLGILAGGIAHDFNNLLTGIYGYMDLARSASKDAQMTEYLEAMFATMKRAKALTLQLLTFSKGGFPIQKVTPLIPFIQETAQFALSGSNSSCRFLVDENLPPCNIDKNQIAQVIDNIVINAQQAMPGGGTVEITAQNLSFGENEHPSLDRGNYVKISIKDSGIGIPKEIMPRIFDPFYTTKIKGHGLGLATCYSIVKRHGGCIDVESEPGKGSTFHVYLPASMENIVVHTHAAVKHTGKGVIVVADDEEVVRRFGKCLNRWDTPWYVKMTARKPLNSISTKPRKTADARR
jgi:PAS domain S-box-containing protein